MSRGRKPASYSIGSGWEEIFNRSVGTYLQTIIVELGAMRVPLSNDSGEDLLEKVRKKKALPKINSSEVPYTIPTNWVWCRLGEICDYGSSRKAEPKQITTSTWVLDLEDIEKETSTLLCKIRFSERNSLSTKSVFQKGDVLYSKLRPYLDKVIVADEDGVCTTEILPLNFHKEINPYFLMLVLKLKHFLGYVSSVTKGMKMPRLGTNEGRMALVPLPPLQEQNIILAFLNDLKSESLKPAGSYFNQEVEQKVVALHKSQLTSSSISTELTHQLSLVQQLRRQLLQEAVQGKLVAQDPADEPAGVLLGKIKAEKERLVKAGKLKKDKALPAIKGEEIPFEIPEGWVWCRLGEICKDSFYGPRFSNSDYVSEGIPTIRTTDMTDNGLIELKNTPKVKITDDKKIELYKVQDGDLLLTRSGSIGIMAIFRGNYLAIPSAYLIRFRFYKEIFPEFIFNLLKSPFWQELLGLSSTATAQVNINATNILKLPIPLPPLSEQHRIVQKLEQLLHRCDALQAGIAEGKGYNALLLGQVLREALTPPPAPPPKGRGA